MTRHAAVIPCEHAWKMPMDTKERLLKQAFKKADGHKIDKWRGYSHTHGTKGFWILYFDIAGNGGSTSSVVEIKDPQYNKPNEYKDYFGVL